MKFHDQLPDPIIFWVAWMSRWGEPSPEHAYPEGVYTCPDQAKAQGEAEMRYRGLKYEHQHCPAYLDDNHKDANMEPPTSVLVASVKGHGRVHFLGVYTTEELAGQAAARIYPGWTLVTKRMNVNEPIPD